MIIETYKIVLKNDGWNVKSENGYFFVYKYAKRATVFNFETEELAWQWLKRFLESIRNDLIGTNINN